MAVLTTQQRNTLESVVKEARKLAETGARNALISLAVNHPEPFQHMSLEQRALRNRLRNKARLLGDELPASGHQEINRLSYELAYENWHKMLFAKFLEANNLLMHPEGVAVTMEECDELYKDEGFIDKWDTAATYASKMLPAIFRTDDPLMQVSFASNDRIKLEEIIDALEPTIFTTDDALGWVYQFWQSQAKEDINKSGAKIDGAKLPAVTQLFTEPYMVNFLIDNTLGAWWVGRNPGVKPPVKFEYLRLLDDSKPAAGSFEGWPDKTAEVTSLDPCMGSGHFVASLFTVLASLRMYEEGLTKEEATDKVITENLHGLEIDARCTQIAAFNLALTAWKFCGHYKELPEMNLACSGIAPKGKVEDWVKLIGNVPRDDKARMENGMRMLYNHFQLAPELGSLLDPSTIKADAFTASFEQLKPVLAKALEGEADKDLVERGVMAAGIAKAGQLLTKKYTLLITNVPYLTRQKQYKILANYTLKYFPDSKHDLANVFIDRMLKSAKCDGTLSVVMPQNWLFLPRYKEHRIKLLENFKWNFIARLGEGGFSSPFAAGAFTILFQISNKRSNNNNSFSAIDASLGKNPIDKDQTIRSGKLIQINQQETLLSTDSRVSLDPNKSDFNLLTKYATSKTGTRTADNPQFLFNFWEVHSLVNNWKLEQSTSVKTNLYSGRSYILLWENGQGKLELMKKQGLASIQGKDVWGKNGVCLCLTRDLACTLYTGQIFDMNVGVIVPNSKKDLEAIWSFCSSELYSKEVRRIDQQLKLTTATLLKVPFDLEYWQKVATVKYPNGLPKPYSDDATQWLFHGHPIKTDNPLQVAIARMLDYRWPAENDTEMELADEARELINEVKTFDYLSDDDGIFCVPSVNSEDAGADRVRAYLQQVFGNDWNHQTIGQLLTKVEAASSSLEDYLRKEFFAQHCKVFKNRPFIWNIWDGRPDGFSALVNYHTLTKENLSKLIYTYLGDWIRMCEAKKKAGESGAEGLLIAALKLKEKLELILKGEAPYDIFVRWKPLEQQPIGWEPDLNDGVRLNIRPFVEAGVLRSRFNIKWGVDRGKNPPGSYWGEVRNNDTHLSLEEKLGAREKKNEVLNQ